MWIDKQKTINLQLEMPVRLSTYRKGNAIPPLPGTNIFHSTELFHVFEMTRGYEPLLIVAYIGNRPVGKLLAVIRKSVRLFPLQSSNDAKFMAQASILMKNRIRKTCSGNIGTSHQRSIMQIVPHRVPQLGKSAIRIQSLQKEQLFRH